MMESSKNKFSLDAPAGWTELFIRTGVTAVVAFVVMQLKEYFDAGRLDTPGTAADAGLIAAGIFIVNIIIMMTKGKS